MGQGELARLADWELERQIEGAQLATADVRTTNNIVSKWINSEGNFCPTTHLLSRLKAERRRREELKASVRINRCVNREPY